MKKRILNCLVVGLVVFFAAPVLAYKEGSSNNFFGYSAGSSITTGGSNSFFGAYAGYNNTTGHSNSFLGKSAGYFNTTGFSNSFVGIAAGYKNTTGNANSIFGWAAGYDNTTGTGNSFFGSLAGYDNTTGNYNSFFGRSAGQYNTTGIGNSFFGRFAGLKNTVGNYNVFLGYHAGYNETGSNKLYISNSDTDYPLIYGDFGKQYLEVNGDLNVVGYVQLDLTDRSPPSADCDESFEYGRMKVDATNELLYLCVVSGWQPVSVGGGTGSAATCSVYLDEFSCTTNNCRWNKNKQTCQ